MNHSAKTVCPKCKKEVSEFALLCPNCSCSLESQPPIKENSVSPSNNSEMCPSRPLMSNRKKTTICISLFIATIMIIFLWSWKGKHDTNIAQQRDLSSAFGFTFAMTMDDVIKYEEETYGHIEYQYDPEVNRLDFAPYHDDWKHRYFFSNETGLLEEAYYMDALENHRDELNPTCEHAQNIKTAVLDIIGEWDSDSHDGLFYYAVGQVNGVNVKITYQAGYTQAIFIYADE